MTLVSVFLLTLLNGAVRAQDVPYYPRSVKDDQDIGGINQNFRDLTNRPRDFTDSNPTVGLSNTVCGSTAALTGGSFTAGYVTGGNCTDLITLAQGTTTVTGQTQYSSTSGITMGGNPLAFNIMASSADAPYVGGSGASTLAVPASSATYTFDCMGMLIVSDTEIALRFNGDTGATYQTEDQTLDSFGNAVNDSGTNANHCYMGRNTVAARTSYPFNCHAQIDVYGNMAEVTWKTAWHQSGQTLAFSAHGACEYVGASAITNVSLVAITGGGAFGGHTELRRIR